MPKKSSKACASGKSQRGSQVHQKKVVYKQSTWQCGSCQEIIDSSKNICLSCYQGLYYYCYINMHFFVEKDHSYTQDYFASPLSPSLTKETKIDRKMSEETNVSSEDQQELTINWVEDLLIGE